MDRLTHKARYEAGYKPNKDVKDWQVADRLGAYENTGLTPEQIMELKERDTEKAPKIHKNAYSSAYTCPNCNLVLINKAETAWKTGWFAGKHYKFCPDCGQRIKWEK